MSSSLKDLQRVAVRKVDVSSVFQDKYHSPAEWAGCRVTDSHPPTNEPCRQTFAARGRPRLSYREHHWIAPIGLTAAQPGPWLRPVTYSPSQIDNTDQAKPPDIRHPRKTQNRQKRIQVVSPPTKEERDKGREAEKGAPGGAKILQALVTLVSTVFSLPNLQHQPPK